MELKIEIEPLKSRRVFIATPAYGGMQSNVFTQCQLQLQDLLMKCGITSYVVSMANESLITRARNKLAAKFLSSDCTDLLFIDSDIEFRAEDVISLLHFTQGDKLVMGGAYPLKALNWEAIKKAVLAKPDISDDELAKMGAMYVSHVLEEVVDIPKFEPIEAKELGTGFMLIKREALVKLAPFCKSYQPYSIEGMEEERITEFFPAGVFGDEYLSEDYAFCRKLRDIGEKIYLAPWVNLNHYGTFCFRGDLQFSAALIGEIH